MFDWFFEFLLNISRGIFKVIDKLIDCANVLCGIGDISVNGETTNFIEFLFTNSSVTKGFAVAGLTGFCILIFFTIFAILKNMVKEKESEAPLRTFAKAFKSLLLFLFVPFIMLTLVNFTNVFMVALNKATLNGANSIGQFLFEAFGQDALFENMTFEGINYMGDIDLIEQVMEISDYDFILSWIVGLIVMFTVGSSMLVFVDRAISLVILYIAAPFSISASVLDDGARFKLWRDQVLTKFLVGYGTILAINIYSIIVAMVSSGNFHFFIDDNLLDLVCKMLVIIGGAFTMKKAMALIGNLVSQGAGTQELIQGSLVGSPIGLAKGIWGGVKMGAGATWNTARVIAQPKDSITSLKNRIVKGWQFQDAKEGGSGSGLTQSSDNGNMLSNQMTDSLNNSSSRDSVKSSIENGASDNSQNLALSNNSSNEAGKKMDDAISSHGSINSSDSSNNRESSVFD